MTPLALSFYLAWTRTLGGLADGSTVDDGTHDGGRPDGPLLWVHAADPARLSAIAALAERLGESEHGVTTLLTLAPDAPLPGRTLPATVSAVAPSGLLIRHAPPDRLGPVRAFLARWRPDLLLWVGGDLRPALIAGARMPRLLIEGAPGPQLLACGGWMPGLVQAVVPLFDQALAASPQALQRLRRAGLPEPRIAMVPLLDAPMPVLPCNERERRDLAGTLGARSVWLAADLPLAELPEVIAAQLRALRSAHRLLMILAPRHPEEAGAMAQALVQAGLRTALRTDGAEPDEDVQVYLVEGTAELGLWYRLAPLTYVGGTLVVEGAENVGGRSPFEAAALGSALLHGPHLVPHEGAWRRLAAVGAARQVEDGEGLGQAIEALLAPDRMAAMAHGAWDVATEGSEVANRVADMILARLPAPGAVGALPGQTG